MSQVVPHSRPWITDDDEAAVQRQLRSGMVAEGEVAARFEAALAGRLGMAGAVATPSGTAALVLALRALDLEPGSEVVVPTYCCRNVADAVVAAGCRPAWCDSGPTWVADRAAVAAAVTARTSCIVAVHLFGIPAPVAELATLGLPLVEDAAQALGTTVDGVPVGALADVAVLSFHATKCLTTGEGGAVVARHPEVAERVRGFGGGPLSDLQAALGLSQLARLDDATARRRARAERYFTELDGVAAELPHEVRGASSFFRFPVRSPQPFEEVAAAFEEQGVTVRRGVDALLHRTFGGGPDGTFPVAEAAFEQTVSIPVHASLDADEEARVVAAARQVWRAA